MNKLIGTILIAGAAGAAAAWAWNKYGKKPCPCKKALGANAKTAAPGAADTSVGPPPAGVQTMPIKAPTDSLMAFDGWRNAY